MTLRPSTAIAEIIGCFGSREKTASHGLALSSCQCTTSEVGVESTVTGPDLTREMSTGKFCASESGANNRARRSTLRRISGLDARRDQPSRRDLEQLRLCGKLRALLDETAM